MQVTIVLEHNYGHPDNRPTKESVLLTIAEKLPNAIKGIKDSTIVGLNHWSITKIDAT